MSGEGADVLTGVSVSVWLWVSLLAGAGCAVGSAWAWRRGRSVRHRSRALLARPAEDTAAPRRPRLPGMPMGPTGPLGPVAHMGPKGVTGLSGARKADWARWAARRHLRAGTAALGAAAFAVSEIGGPVGWLVAGVGAYGVWRWIRGREAGGRTTEAAEEARTSAGQLPLAAELMAACLTAGSGPEQAADAVGRSLGGPLGTRLVRVATELRLGGEPAVVWGRFGSLPGSEGFARCMERAGTAGVPAVEPVARLAVELRTRDARAATARARRAAVLVTGPLGLCFLPAFLAVGVAPVVLGLARSLL